MLPLDISDEFLGVYPYLQSHTASWMQVFKGCVVLIQVKPQHILRMITFCLYNGSVPGTSYRTHPALLPWLKNSSECPSRPNSWFVSHTSILLHVITERNLTFGWDDLGDHHHFQSHNTTITVIINMTVIIIISYHHIFVTTVPVTHLLTLQYNVQSHTDSNFLHLIAWTYDTGLNQPCWNIMHINIYTQMRNANTQHNKLLTINST